MEGIVIQQGQGQIQGLGSGEAFSQKSTSEHFINVLNGLIIANQDSESVITSPKDPLAEIINSLLESKDCEDSKDTEEMMSYLVGYCLENPQLQIILNQVLKEESITKPQGISNVVSNQGDQGNQLNVMLEQVQDMTRHELKAEVRPTPQSSLEFEKLIGDSQMSTGKIPLEAISVSAQENNKDQPQLVYWSENGLNRLVQNARTTLSALQLEKSLVAGDLNVDKLQKVVEENVYQQSGLTTNYQSILGNSLNTQETSGVQSLDGLNQEDIVSQVQTNVVKHLTDKDQEFVIKLKPEHLGEITVRLSQESQKLVLTMTAVSEATAKLLNSHLGLLHEALRPYQAEIQPVVTQAEASQEANFQQQGGFTQGGQHSFAGYTKDSDQGRSLLNLYEKASLDAGNGIELEKLVFNQQGLDRYI